MVCFHGIDRVGRKEATRLCVWTMAASVLSNALILSIKSYAYYQTASMSYLAGAVEVLFDLVVAVTGFCIVIVARKPASAYYRFGYGKIEALGALMQSLIVVYGSVWLILQSINGFLHPVPMKEKVLGIVLLVVSTAVTVCLVLVQSSTLAKTRSLLIASDAVHARGHLLLNLGILIAILASYVPELYFFDPLFGALVGVYMIAGSCKVCLHALRNLLDAEAPPAVRSRIEKIIMESDSVSGFHKLRTRYAGSELFIQAHIEMPGAISLMDSHCIVHRVEDRIIHAFPHAQVVLHQDPEEEKEGHATEF